MQKRTRILISTVALIALVFAGTTTAPALAATGPLCFVDADATSGENTGNSWPDAYTDLQSALTDTNCTEIWVAEGTYTPDASGADRSATFQLVDGVEVYGGFDGTESSRTERDAATYLTVLSGDIDINDSQTPVITDLDTVTGNTDNSYHVVTGSGTSSATVLDGFTITAGYADAAGVDTAGAGVYNDSGSPTLTNLTFSGNAASGTGGGVYNDNSSSPTLTNVTFSKNTADQGGGIYNQGTLTISNADITSNTATESGGGIYSDGALLIENSTIDNNYAENNCGGGIHFAVDSDGSATIQSSAVSNNTSSRYGAGIFAGSSTCGNSEQGALELDDVEVFGNLATGSEGGGIVNFNVPMIIDHSAIYNNRSNEDGDAGIGAWGPTTISNTTISGNYAVGDNSEAAGGLGIYGGYDVYLYNVTITDNTMESTGYGSGGVADWDDSESTLHVYNSIIANNHGGVHDDCYLLVVDMDFHDSPNILTQDLTDCRVLNTSAVINTDPALDILDDNGGPTKTHALEENSPAINAGDNTVCEAAPVNNLDQRGVTRPVGDACDIGAYEFSAEPENDFFILAFDISLPNYTSSVDTTTATQSAHDPDLQNECDIADTGEATVWYSYTSTENTAIAIDTFGSDYDTFIAVWVDGTSGLELVACSNATSTLDGAEQLAIQVSNGNTYYIEVGQP